MMRLIVIRHGQSLHVQRGILAQNRACPGLTETGFEQAHKLADRLRLTGEVREASVFLTSPVLRVRQTAEILAPALPGLPLMEAELTELRTGEAEGLTWEEYSAHYERFDLRAHPDRPFAPGGESWNQYVARVRAMLHDLAQRYQGKTVVAVSHAGWIVTSTLVLFAALEGQSRVWLEPDNTGINEWRVEDERWVLARFNDTAHLRS